MDNVTPYDVFCSYCWRDRTAVEAVAQVLVRRGLRVFLDRWYLIPGRSWPQALEEILASCRAVAVFVGPQGLGDWQQREAYLALNRKDITAVIPVLLPGADPALGFLSLHTWVDLRPGLDDPVSLEILQLAVQGRPQGHDLKERVQAIWAAVCPYRGLRPFREEDAPFFFGRETFIDRLTQAVSRQTLVALVGASGCGKSSVARAGLIPSLRSLEGSGLVWETVTLLPGDRPLQALAAALLPLLEPEMTEVDRLAEVNKLAQYFQNGDLALRDVAARILAKQPGTERLLLVVDQWEELYTLTREEEPRRRFLDEILEATQAAPLSVVLTLRGDFFGQALSYRPLADRLQDAVVNLGPMTRAELAQAIEKPANKVGLTFEPGLAARLLNDVGQEPGNLPLLEFALTNLWERRQSGQLLHQAYDDMGRVQGALAQKAEELYQRLSPLEQQAAGRVFLELVQTGENTEDTRRRAPLTEVGAETRELVKKLTDARLVVTGREAATGHETVEVAHEALIQHWTRLQGWLNADREFLLWRQRLRHDLEDWQRTGHDSEVLLRGTLLAEARGWLSRRPGDLSPGERHFIQASIGLQEQEEEEHRKKQRRELEQAQALAAEQQRRAEAESQSRRRLSFLTAALLVAFLGAVGAAVFAWVQRNDALRQTKIAYSQQLAAQAISLLDSQLDLALLLSVEAVEAYKSNPTLPGTNALLLALQKKPQLRRYLHAHKGRVESVAFSPDGTTLASGGGYADKTIRLWDVASGQPRGAPLEGHQGQVRQVAFSPDGQTLASMSTNEEGTVRLWDVASSQPRGAPLTGHQGEVYSVAFSPDGTTLASGGADGTIRLLDVASGQPRGASLTGHQDGVFSVAFSPEGKTLASGSKDKTVRLWNLAYPALKSVLLTGDQSSMTSVAFSPDGQTLASGREDGIVRLWNLANPQLRSAFLTGHHSTVDSVAFSPDGKILATASFHETIILWDVTTGQPRGAPLTGGQSPVTSVAFSPDGNTLASGGDKTVRLWDVASGQPRGAPLTGHKDRVTSVAFAPDGQTLASRSTNEEGTVRLWDVATGQPRGAPLTGHQDVVYSVAFSPDGQTLALGSYKSISLWDVDVQSWLKRACTIANRNLTREEWRRYMGDRPYRKTCPDLPLPKDE